MLSKNNVMTSISLASELAEKNKVVTVKPNTILAELVRTTNAALVGSVIQENPSAEDVAGLLEVITEGTLENPSEHSKTSDAYIDEVAKAVNNHVSFAKNIVAPIVVDFAERVTNYMASFKPPQAASEFNIDVVDMPELLEDEGFVDTLRFYINKSVVQPDLIPGFGLRTDEQLHELLQTGDADSDEAITAWYSRKGPEFFQHVWMSFFRAREGNEYQNFGTYEDIAGAKDVFYSADVALAMYLFCQKLFEAVPEDVAGQALNAYQNTLAQTRDFAGAVLTDFIARVKGYISSKTLVVASAPNGKAARVFGPVYRAWLEAGGCPEIIIGLLISGKRFTLQSLIDEDVENLKAKWKTFENFHNAAQSNKYFDYYKDALRLKFAELMAGVTKEEETFAQTTPNYIAAVNANFESELANIRSGDLDNIYMLAMKLVCRSRFYYTDAEIILCDIEEARRVNPNIDVREAALIATANYVFDFIADQMVAAEDI